MSRKTLFEQNEGRRVLELKEYCEDMPVWKGLAKSALAGIVLYVVILAAFIFTASDQAEQIYRQLGSFWTIIAVAGSMAFFIAFYSLISDVIFRSGFNKSRSTLSRYRSDVLQLEKLEHEQDKS